MLKIFISYRREDSRGSARRLFQHLQHHFGRESVLMDVNGAVPQGRDVVAYMNEVVGSCDVVIAVIGPAWLTATDEVGKRRLDDPRDSVRLELENAFRRHMAVLPVFVGGAEVPAAKALPDGLRLLAHGRSVELRDDRWDFDVENLIKNLMVLLQRSQALAGGDVRSRRIEEPQSLEHPRRSIDTHETSAPSPPMAGGLWSKLKRLLGHASRSRD